MKSYIRASGLIIVIALVIFSVACVTGPKLSPMQVRQITTRMFECNYENAYRATLTVFQDQGYVVKNTDMDSGLIMATVDRQTSGGSRFLQALAFGYVADKGTEVEVSCMVNSLSEWSTEVRINIQEVKYGQSSIFSGTGKQSSKQIYDHELYQDIFNQIHVEIKRREAMQGITRSSSAYQSDYPSSLPQQIKVKVENASIRLKPDHESQVIHNVAYGTFLEPEEKTAEWYKVSVNKDGYTISGYIHQDFVEKIN